MRKKVKKLNSRLTDSDNKDQSSGNGFLDGVQHILFLEQLGDELGVYVLTRIRECLGTLPSWVPLEK